jgi:pilus assembly protein CpaE
MPYLAGLIISQDETFKVEVTGLLRSGPIPTSVIDEGAAKQAAPDIVLVDGRSDPSAAILAVERARRSMPNSGIFLVARAADPNLIIQAMRAGANEFLTWPPAAESVHEAVLRASARRDSLPGTRAGGTTLVFFGAKGGVGTTTLAVNVAVDLARTGKKSTVIVDLDPGLGEASLLLGVRPRYTLLDAMDNLERLDPEFLKELTVKHKSGVDVLAGSEKFERPGTVDAGAVEEVVRFLTRQYDYVVVDAGRDVNPCTVMALYAADHIFLIGTPDVAATRNAQRLLEHVRPLGACGDRIRLVLNRTVEPLPIPLKHIESVVGLPVFHTFPSDFKNVIGAVNTGVPVVLAGGSDFASQVDKFARRILIPGAEAPAGGSIFGLTRASLW